MRIRPIFILLLLASSLSAIGSPMPDSTNIKFDRYFFEGVRLREQGEYASAFDLYRYCYSLNPHAPALLSEMGRLYFAIGLQAEGTRYLEEAYDLDPDNKNYGTVLGSVYERQGRSEDAVSLYENMAERFPSEESIRFKLANIYVQAGEIDKAIAIYNDLEKQNATTAMEAANYAEVRSQLYKMTGQTEKSLNEFRVLAKRFPDIVEFKFKYTEILLDQQKYPEANEQLQEIAKTDSTSGLYHFTLAEYYIGTNQKDAAISEMLKVASNKDVNPEQKLTILYQFIGTDTDENNLPKKEYNILLDKMLIGHPTDVSTRISYAQLLEMQGDTIRAMEICKPITEFAPTESDVWKLMLEYAINRQAHSEIHSICTQAKQYIHEEAIFYLYDAISYYIEGNTSEAKNILLEALEKIDPIKDPSGMSDVYSQLGDLAYEEKDTQKAFAYFDKALALNPQNVGVLNNYAYFLAQDGGDLAKAERMAALCVKLVPDNPVSLDTYGWIFFLREKYTLALLYVEKALDLTIENPDADVVEHHGDILFKLGREDEAVQEWKRAKEIGGGGSSMLDKKIKKQTYIPEKK